MNKVAPISEYLENLFQYFRHSTGQPLNAREQSPERMSNWRTALGATGGNGNMRPNLFGRPSIRVLRPRDFSDSDPP
jgi:hypothetical protein